jgi:methylated-DNA-[protein]-cysteine S-methyltransferase
MTSVSLKARLRELLDAWDVAEIATMAAERRRVLPSLVALTYDADTQVACRAVEALGVAANRVAEDDPTPVREQLRRLFWLISEESGGICWRAPEAMAEIVRWRPEEFGDYVSITALLINEMAEEDLQHFRPSILRAIGRLSGLAGDYVLEVLPKIVAALDDSLPQSRGMAVWCLDQLGRSDLLAERPDLAADEGPVDLYEEGTLDRTTVGMLVKRAVSPERGS